jgi:hypothetical protein
MSLPRQPKPVFVPIALAEDEARAAFNACRATFAQLTAMGEAAALPELARAMYHIGAAIDKAREEADRVAA